MKVREMIYPEILYRKDNLLPFLLAWLLLILLGHIPLKAQIDPESHYKVIMEEGVKLMEAGDYKSADVKFKQVLRSMEVLPADITFYFGKNSYFLDEYKQSINWLNKYMELKGTQGRFFDESVTYLKRAELSYKLETEKNSRQVQEEFSKTNEFDCRGKTHFQCPLCKGEGVLIKPGKMNNTVYQTCPFCDGEGLLPCEKYKKYVRGELKIENQ
jgi:hypothetical protein